MMDRVSQRAKHRMACAVQCSIYCKPFQSAPCGEHAKHLIRKSMRNGQHCGEINTSLVARQRGLLDLCAAERTLDALTTDRFHPFSTGETTCRPSLASALGSSSLFVLHDGGSCQPMVMRFFI